jgi:hypothetical protein
MATGGLPPVMALTAADDVVFFAIMYPQILPRFLDTSLEVFSRIAELLTGAGGKRYLADWHGTMTEQGWRRHRETRHDRRLKCKQTFDPIGLLLAAPAITGRLASHSPHPQAGCSPPHTDAPAPPSSSPISSTATPN